MANVKFTFATENYLYADALKMQVPDIRIELIDIKGLGNEDAMMKIYRNKLTVPDYFQDGDRVVFIDCDVIVNKNLDDLFGKVSDETPVCIQYTNRRNRMFNSGLFVLLVNTQTRALYKRALDMYDASQPKHNYDEFYAKAAIDELKVNVNYCDCLQSFDTVKLNPNCYINHFVKCRKNCDLYQNFLNKVPMESRNSMRIEGK